jgi:hypothetical protein
MLSILRHAFWFVLRVLLALMLVSLAVATRGESSPAQFHMVIVEAAKPQPTREAWQRAFVASLHAALARAPGVVRLELATQSAPPRVAAEQLRTGRCDAALLIGDDRPFALRRLTQPTLAATISFEDGRQSLFLIIGTADVILREALEKAFSTALADAQFRAVVEGRVPSGTTLAFAPAR